MAGLAWICFERPVCSLGCAKARKVSAASRNVVCVLIQLGLYNFVIQRLFWVGDCTVGNVTCT